MVDLPTVRLVRETNVHAFPLVWYKPLQPDAYIPLALAALLQALKTRSISRTMNPIKDGLPQHPRAGLQCSHDVPRSIGSGPHQIWGSTTDTTGKTNSNEPLGDSSKHLQVQRATTMAEKCHRLRFTTLLSLGQSSHL